MQSGSFEYPVGLGEQFRRNLSLYSVGSLLLLAQQLLMAKRDFLVKAAVDAADMSLGKAAAEAALLMLITSLCAAVVRVLSRVTVFTGGRNVEYELRAALLSRLHKLGPAFFRKMPTGEIMSRATNDLAQVRLLLGFGILNIVSSVFAFTSALYVMASMSGKLTLLSLVTMPVLMLVTRSFSTEMFARNRENQEAVGKMSDRVLASLSGVRVVRSFSLETVEVENFKRISEEYLQKSLKLAKVRGLMGPLMGAISSVGVLIVFWYGGSLVLSGEMTKGAFVSFWMALLRLTWPMLAIGFVAAIIQRGRAGYQRLRAIYDAIPDMHDGDRDLSQIRGQIEVKNLSFAYGARNVVDQVSFKVDAGKTLAIVGRTGSGKSTIATLLARLMPTPEGSVFLDGVDVCELPLSMVRSSIGYAQQDAFLFSTTVTQNIGYSLDDAEGFESKEAIAFAAKEAEVYDEVISLPEGFDTVVGERGVQLSGGQRQRIALARALVRKPQVLVLDDPLSAVDAKTEARILEAIERQGANRTVILITHRVLAAKRCDSILVLDEGRIVEHGTHDELVKQGGVYASFAEEQQLKEDLEAFDVEAHGTPMPAPVMT